MNLLAQVYPANIPPAYVGKDDLLILRERMLQATLLIFAVVGLPSVLVASWGYLRIENFIFPAIYSGVYALILLMLFYRNISYHLRVYTMVAVAFVLALSEFMSSGQNRGMEMFLIAFITLAAILLDNRSAIAAMAIGIISLAAAGIYSAVDSALSFAMSAEWINSSLVFFLVVTIITGSIRMIISGLGANLARQAEQARNLEFQRADLEQHVQERTQHITRRVTQLRTAADITRAISVLSAPDELLQQVADIVKERFGLYYVGIFLLDYKREFAVLKAGTGEAGRQMVTEGYQLAVQGSSMIGWAISNRLPKVALDSGADAVRFNNPQLPLTRSELALPIIVHDEVLGAMTIHSEQAEAFDENDIAILQSIADSLGVAQENDRLYNETRKSLEEIRTLNREYLQRAWAETAESHSNLSISFENRFAPGSSQAVKSIQTPLVIRDEIIGYLDLEMNRETLTDDEVAFIENVTTQTAIAMENARLLYETERRAIQEQKLNELAARFTKAMSIEEILRAAVVEFGQLPNVAEVSIQVRPTEARKTGETLPAAGDNGKERAA